MRRTLLYPLLLLPLLVGCATKSQIDDVVVGSKTKALPSDNITHFSDILRQFGKDADNFFILRGLRPNSVGIGIRDIENATSDTKLLHISSVIETAIQEIFAGVYKPVLKPISLVLVRDFNALPDLSQQNGRLPQDTYFAIDGAITESSKVSLSTDLSFDATIGSRQYYEADIGYDFGKNIEAKTISLDLKVLDVTPTNFNSLLGFTSNSLTIYNTKNNTGFGFYILGNGFNLNSDVVKNQSEDYALRVLAEYSIMQLIGRYLQVPYWLCLNIEKPDKDEMMYLKDYWRKIPFTKKAYDMQHFLKFYGADIEYSSAFDSETLEAVKYFKQAYGITTDDIYDLLEEMFLNLPFCEYKPSEHARFKALWKEYRATHKKITYGYSNLYSR